MGNWIFLLPALIFFVGYMLYPILRVLFISFTDYRYLSRDPANFVGLQNYIEALSDPLVYQGLWRAAPRHTGRPRAQRTISHILSHHLAHPRRHPWGHDLCAVEVAL